MTSSHELAGEILINAIWKDHDHLRPLLEKLSEHSRAVLRDACYEIIEELHRINRHEAGNQPALPPRRSMLQNTTTRTGLPYTETTYTREP